MYTAQPQYPHARLVTVETDLSKGLHCFTLVGLPDKAVEESRDRVGAALKNSGFTSPKSTNQKVVVSLAPADLKKEGPIFDVAIALCYLRARGDIRFKEQGKLFLGELSLDGKIRPVHGVLPVALMAREKHFTELYVPRENAAEAALVEGVSVYPVDDLESLVQHLDTKQPDEDRVSLTPESQTTVTYSFPESNIDFSDIRGQDIAKRGLLIAASGRHNIALYGPPGTGKTLLARAFTGILPPLTFEESLEATAIHSLAHSLADGLVVFPPFRSPHHSASHVSLVGGGTHPKPGEVTLAHRGVLFLDEFPEFERRTIDALRQPLEDRVVTISRARGTIEYPANFILVAAMNPTPLGGAEDDGILTERERLRYQKKISGPIIDRIDMWIEVANIDHETLSEKKKTSNESEKIRNQVKQAREKQYKRFGCANCNSDMSVKDIDNHITLSDPVKRLLNLSAKQLNLSPRSYHRVVKLARTIADLDESEDIGEPHLLEALQYRPKNLFA